MTKANKAIRKAVKAGYKITSTGMVQAPDGTKNRGYSHNRRETNQYLKVFVPEAGTWIYVHRLAAFLKFGNQIYQRGQYVSHKNAKGTDNRMSNITLGPRRVPVRRSVRPITDIDITTALQLHENGYSS